MAQDENNKNALASVGQSRGTSVLANSAVSLLKERQTTTSSGAKQFLVEYLTQSILNRSGFVPDEILDELRGHRLSVDAIIDIYVPEAARSMGQMWMDDEADFASVTVASMRLQALLSLASSESLHVVRPVNNTVSALIVVPLGEQHTLGTFILAAQLRRLGADVDLSFCETSTDFVSRVFTQQPDMILFTASGRATLETVGQLVLNLSKALPTSPLCVLGGAFVEEDDVAKGISGVDLVTRCAREALSLSMSKRTALSDRNKQ